MDNQLHDLIFSEELSPEERRELTKALEEDAELREAFRKWRNVQKNLREEINRAIPDRKLLVLYVLQKSDEELLTPGERRYVREARVQLEEAFEAHPGLQDVCRRIESEKDVFEAVWEAHTESDTVSRRRLGPVRTLTGSWMMRAAAVVGFIVCAGIFYLWLSEFGHSMETVRAPDDHSQTVELADGSLVLLTKGTVLSYDLSSDERSERYTRLKGTALFEVVSGDRPFVVETPMATARVLGTTFGITATSEETEITVAQGRVAFTEPNDTLQARVVSAGERSRRSGVGPPSEPVSVNLNEVLSWSGRLFFRDAKVADIADQLSTRFDQPVTVAEELIDETVTGTFDQTRGLSDILQVIATTLDARVERTGGGYRLAESAEQN